MGKNVCNGDDMSFTDLMEGQFKVSWSGDGVSAAAVLERGKPLQSWTTITNPDWSWATIVLDGLCHLRASSSMASSSPSLILSADKIDFDFLFLFRLVEWLGTKRSGNPVIEDVSFILVGVCFWMEQWGTWSHASGPEGAHWIPKSILLRVAGQMVPLKGTGPLTYLLCKNE